MLHNVWERRMLIGHRSSSLELKLVVWAGRKKQGTHPRREKAQQLGHKQDRSESGAADDWPPVMQATHAPAHRSEAAETQKVAVSHHHDELA